MGNSQMIELKRDRTIDYLKEADDLLLILDKAQKEHDVQKYIKENQKWFIPGSLLLDYDFGHHEAKIIPEFALGNEYRTDYLLIGRNSTAKQIVLVEFEDVNVDYCQKSQNAPTESVRKGLTQINDWMRWMENCKDYMLKNTVLSQYIQILPSWAIHYCLVVSRRSKMNDMANMLRGEATNNGFLNIVSYDRLVDNTRMLVNGF